ncbi:hypothetical protein QTP88_003817 [Uroleucon formosanum]
MTTVNGLNHTINEHVMYNLDVPQKNDAITTILDQKRWLVKTELVTRYVARFHSSMNGIVNGARKVVRATESIHHRLVSTLDFEFQNIIYGLDHWWSFYNTLDELNMTHTGSIFLVVFRIDGGVGKDRVIAFPGASPQVYNVFSRWLFWLILVSNEQSNLILHARNSDLHQFHCDRCLVSPLRGREIIDDAAE